MTKVHIRWMIRRDMDEVLDIERRCFEFPWREEDFHRCLRGRNVIGYVAELAAHDALPPVVAFILYEFHKRRIHLLNFAVHPEWQRTSVGRQVIEYMQAKLSPSKRVRITCEVRESNIAAQMFLRRVGFKATAVLRAYYEDCDDDAFLFHYRDPKSMEAIA